MPVVPYTPIERRHYGLFERNHLRTSLGNTYRSYRGELEALEREFNAHDIWQPTDFKPQGMGENGHREIVCPYCLQKFGIQDMAFRANAVPDYNGAYTSSFGLEEDEAYGDYWLHMSGDRGEVMRPHILNMDPAKGEIKQITFKVDQNGRQETHPYNQEARKLMSQYQTISVADKYDHVSSVRICPHCHTELPYDMGFVRNYVFTLMGNTSCGKTVYLRRLTLSLINGNFLGGQFLGQIANDAANTIDSSVAQVAAYTFQYNGAPMADATPVGYIFPLIISLTNMQLERFYITLFDYPGEGIWQMEDKFFQDIAKRNQANSNGWIFLFDTGTIPAIHGALQEQYRQIRDMDEASGEQKATPAQILNQVQQHYCAGQIFTKPVAFVLSKSDLIRQCADALGGVALNPDQMTFLRQPAAHSNPDLVDAYLCDSQIRKFLSGVAQGNATTAADIFTRNNSAWFACSSTTVSPEYGILPEGVVATGLRDTCALEWLLYRCGLLRCADNFAQYPPDLVNGVTDWAYSLQMGRNAYEEKKQEHKQLAEILEQVKSDLGFLGVDWRGL